MFKNFSIWRGRLPHWRADDVRYYVNFRHRRPLNEDERHTLYKMLVRPDGRHWDLLILCVLPERTELVFTVRESPAGKPYELSDIIEKGKSRAGRAIIKKTGERYPPFYSESFDRIIRDEAELEERWMEIMESPAGEGLAEDPSEYPTLYAQNALED